MVYNCEIVFIHLRHGTKFRLQFNIHSPHELSEGVQVAMARRVGTDMLKEEINRKSHGQEFIYDYGFLSVSVHLVTTDPDNGEGIISQPTHKIE